MYKLRETDENVLICDGARVVGDVTLGKGFPEVLEGGYDMGDDELLEAGLNDSAAHVDFMIGTGDLSIDGIRPDGVSVPVFRNGNWAF